MGKDSLRRVFEAGSVAVIGASSDPTRIGGRPVAMLKAHGFDGPVYPINPNRDEIQGLPAYAAIGDVPGPVDLAICAVPGAMVEDVLGQCAAKGVGGVVVFAGGFAEVGGEGVEQQARLTAIARETGLRLIGPNCMGFANFGRHLMASFHPAFALEMPTGRIGLVSQSGAFGGLSSMMAVERGVGFSHALTTGNEADVDAADCLAFLAEDRATDVILLYLEGVRNGPAMLDALALARANRKPVIVVKLGRTEAGARAAQSHTSALAGTDRVFEAVFRQFGAYRANSIEEFYGIAAALAVGGLPKGNRVGLVTVSGGVGVLMADDAAARGLDVAPMPAATQRTFKEIVPYAGVNNPLDVTGQIINQPELMNTALRLVLDEADYDAIVGFQGATLAAGDAVIDEKLDMWRGLKRDYPDKFLCVAGLARPDVQARFEAAGLPLCVEPTHATRAAAAGAHFADAFARPPGWTGRPSTGGASTLPSGPLTEVQAMQILGAAGLPMTPHRLAVTADEAVAAAEALGLPVAMKIVSPDILHKTEIGGVRLNLASADAVRSAFAEITDAARNRAPRAAIAGCLVAPMLTGGVETILGIHMDPVFGPLVMFGLGGVLVEVLEDVSFRVAPFDDGEAHRMIDEIKGRAVLDGVRGAPAADIDALAAALATLSRFAAAQADRLLSVDLNPFVVLPSGEGAVALDAVLEVRS